MKCCMGPCRYSIAARRRWRLCRDEIAAVDSGAKWSWGERPYLEAATLRQACQRHHRTRVRDRGQRGVVTKCLVLPYRNPQGISRWYCRGREGEYRAVRVRPKRLAAH